MLVVEFMPRKKFDLSTLPKFPDLSIEKRLWDTGWAQIAGIDEAGRGALAGPVCAAAVILPNLPELSRILAGVRDSKQMTQLQRERFEPLVKEVAISWSVGFATAAEIDEMGIIPATRLAAQRAVDTLLLSPDYLITDYLKLPDIDIPQEHFVKGDMRSLTIASASVLAKTARDAEMRQLDDQFPGYALSRHKGYGTKAHRAAIQKLGKSPIHRQTFQIKD
jgi:ribonuclease HII